MHGVDPPEHPRLVGAGRAHAASNKLCQTAIITQRQQNEGMTSPPQQPGTAHACGCAGRGEGGRTCSCTAVTALHHPGPLCHHLLTKTCTAYKLLINTHGPALLNECKSATNAPTRTCAWSISSALFCGCCCGGRRRRDASSPCAFGICRCAGGCICVVTTHTPVTRSRSTGGCDQTTPPPPAPRACVPSCALCA